MHAAGQLGFDVTRTDAAYATFDGLRRIAIGVPETLDADDCVAQLVLHELCHALVEGDAGLTRVDWGLSNFDDTDVSREYAALRLQAHLADAAGLREAMAPTTSWRPYYEALAQDPLTGSDEAARVACAVIETPLYNRWRTTIERALHETRTLLDVASATNEVAVFLREASA